LKVYFGGAGMVIKNIALNSEIGTGEAKVLEDGGKRYIDINVSNQVGVMKVFVINKENMEKVHIGNLVEGKLRKEVNIDFDDVFIVRDNKNVYWSCQDDDAECFARILGQPVLEKEETTKKETFFEKDNFTWHTVTDGSYFSNEPIIKYILNYPKVLESIYNNRCYHYGIDGDNVAVAVKEDKDNNPFEHLSDCSVYLDGHWIVCANIKENYFYPYEYSSNEGK